MSYKEEGCRDTAYRGRPTEIGNIRNITVEWNDAEGDWRYWLLTLVEFSNGERNVSEESYGNAEWAKRNAEHYGIELPATE